MAYPESCFQNLIGIHGTCEPKEATYWLDDVPGIDISKLAQVAEAGAPTGEQLAEKLIESASRFMAADVEAIYDGQYKVQNSLVTGCSTCSFLTNYSAGTERGILIKNNTESAFTTLLIDKLTVKTNSTGTFNVVIDDGIAPRVIEWEFVAGTVYEFKGLNFETKAKSVKVYFQENTVLLAQLSCKKSGSGCGCSGSSQTVVSDLVYTGLTDGVESQQAFGFLPCAMIKCDAADLLCFLAHSAPRMIGMALLYKSAELYFTSRVKSDRNNKVVGMNNNESATDATKFADLYKDKLNGNGTRGVKDLVFTTLQSVTDVCVVCNSLVATGWATT